VKSDEARLQGSNGGSLGAGFGTGLFVVGAQGFDFGQQRIVSGLCTARVWSQDYVRAVVDNYDVSRAVWVACELGNAVVNGGQHIKLLFANVKR